MKLEQYKQVLSCYRPEQGGPTQTDVAEALSMLEADPELAAWYAEECDFDDSFRDALARYGPPPMDEVVVRAPSVQQNTRWPRLLAAAAIIAAIGGLAVLGLNQFRSAPFDGSAPIGLTWQKMTDFRQAMAAYAASGTIRLDLMNNDLGSLQQFMQTNGGLTGEGLPEVFASARPMGCKIFPWGDRAVSLYCFGVNPGEIVHAFLLPEDEVSGEVLAQFTELQVRYDRQTAGWVAGDTAYLLVAAKPRIDITPLLTTRMAMFLTLSSRDGYAL